MANEAGALMYSCVSSAYEWLVDGNHLAPGQDIRWMAHFFKSQFKQSSLSACDTVSRFIVVQKKGYLDKLSSALLFIGNIQFVK